MIAGNKIGVLLIIIKNEGKHPLQLINKRDALFFKQGQNNFAVGTGFKWVGTRQIFRQRLVIIDLTIHGENMLIILTDERLRTSVYINNGQPFMTQNGIIIIPNPRPVRAAMAQ